MGGGVFALLAFCTIAPAADAPKTGSISGTIDKSVAVKAVRVIDRNADPDAKKMLVVREAKYDPATGTFTLDGLPLPREIQDKDETKPRSYNGVYDLEILTASGAILEGVNLKVPRSDYVEEQPLEAGDPEKLKAIVKKLSQFEDTFEFLAVEGNIQHAAVLVSKLRTKPFFASQPGEVTWRAEVYRFEKPEETWVKRQEELFTLHFRERLQQADFDKKAITFDPALGGLTLTADKPDLKLPGVIAGPEEKPGIRLRTGKDGASKK